MNKPPAFQLYAADFLVGIMGMTDAEVGIYLRMLLTEWLKGPLPGDAKSIRQMIGSKGLPTDSVLEKFTADSEGRLFNPRLERERQKQQAFRESRVAAGKIGGTKRAEKASDSKHVLNTCSAQLDSSFKQNTKQNQALHLQSSSSSTDSLSPTSLSEDAGPQFASERSVHDLISWINSLRPEWKKPAHWSHEEMRNLTDGASRQIQELDADDRRLVSRFMKEQLPQAAGYWQPRSRSQFVKTFHDVFSSVQRWGEKAGIQTSKPTAPKGVIR